MKAIKNLLIQRTRAILSLNLFARETKKKTADFTRKRVLTFALVVAFVLNSKKKSLQLEVDEFAAATLPTGQTVGKDAMVKARKKVEYEAFETLFRATVDVAMEEDAVPRHKGYRLFAIDGSQVSLLVTDDIQYHFGEVIQGQTRCTARMSCLCEVTTGYLVDALLTSYHIGERVLAEKHLDTLESYGKHKTLILFDRGYPSKELIASLMKRGLYFVMRIPRGFNAQIDAQTEPEAEISLGIDDCEARLRIIKLALPSGEIETLLSNLPQEDFSFYDFMPLYNKRWPIETEFDLLKNTLQLETFTGKTYLTIMQDFFATCYLSNLAVSIAEEAQAVLNETQQDKTYKCQHKVNRNILIGRFKREFIQLVLLDNIVEAHRRLDALVQQASRSYSVRSTKPPPPRRAKNTHHKKSIPLKRTF
jgi:hypothetical protein